MGRLQRIDRRGRALGTSGGNEANMDRDTYLLALHSMEQTVDTSSLLVLRVPVTTCVLQSESYRPGHIAVEAAVDARSQPLPD